MTIFRVILGIILTIIGMSVMLGIWFPGLRGTWGGGLSGRAPKDFRGRVPTGAVSSAGFGLSFISVGLALALGHVISKPLGIGLEVCIFAGFFLAIAGSLLDSRAHHVRRGANRLPGEMRLGTPDERQRWMFAAFVALLLIMMILFLLFHAWLAR